MPRQLVVIDPRISSYQSLIDQLGTAYSYLLLDAESDGVSQIANYITANPGSCGNAPFLKGPFYTIKALQLAHPLRKSQSARRCLAIKNMPLKIEIYAADSQLY